MAYVQSSDKGLDHQGSDKRGCTELFNCRAYSAITILHIKSIPTTQLVCYVFRWCEPNPPPPNRMLDNLPEPVPVSCGDTIHPLTLPVY